MRTCSIAGFMLALPTLGLAQDAGLPDSGASGATPPSAIHLDSGPADLPAASGGTVFSQPITFGELPIGAAVTNQYRERGIVFGGSGPVTVNDGSSPTPPVLAGTPLFEGDISGYFVLPGTETPTAVDQFNWDIGFLNEVGSVRMELFGPSGQHLYDFVNEPTGNVRYTRYGGNIGIASWRFSIVDEEPAGFGIDNVYFSVPAQPDLEREKGVVACAVGNPVNPAVGNKYQVETDFIGAGAFPLQVVRTYNSLDGQWQFFSAVEHEAPAIEAVVVEADGKGFTFTPGASSQWVTNPDVTSSLESYDTGTGTIPNWRYRTLDDEVREYDHSGRLLLVLDRSGLSHSYSYDDDSIRVSHSLGGVIVYQLNAEGVITGFSDPNGHQYSYQYDSLGRLVGVAYPDGGGNRGYHYEDASHETALTGITDANGDRFASWSYDEQGRAVSSEHYRGTDRYTFDYSQADHPDTPITTVTNALGKQTSYQYIIVNGVRKLIEVQGHASANCLAANQRYSYDGRGFLASRTDWEGNTTSFVRNEKGQELSRVEGQGSPVERIFSTQWHPDFNLPVETIEPGRVSSFSYDTKGNLLTRTVTKLPMP